MEVEERKNRVVVRKREKEKIQINMCMPSCVLFTLQNTNTIFVWVVTSTDLF